MYIYMTYDIQLHGCISWFNVYCPLFRWCYCWSECILNTLIAIDCVGCFFLPMRFHNFDFECCAAMAFDVTFINILFLRDFNRTHIHTQAHTSRRLFQQKNPKQWILVMRFVHNFKGVYSSKSVAMFLFWPLY